MAQHGREEEAVLVMSLVAAAVCVWEVGGGEEGLWEVEDGWNVGR